MESVRPKKRLGQHFLHDKEIARRIVASLQNSEVNDILEIGPGMGVLTKYLVSLADKQLWVIDVDRESIEYLKHHYPELGDRIIHGDFLQLNPTELIGMDFLIIGNLPYNISSQIFFRLIELRDRVPEMVCMIQKEVAKRIVSPPGNKTYGILSVLLQTFYNLEYLFAVNPGAFNPPPKVTSAVIRLTRNKRQTLECDEKLFFRFVKQGFQNRRKTLRNALKPLNLPEPMKQDEVLNLRAEQLSVADFISLTQRFEALWNK